jgi:malonyl-CoA/methylmalonyl-CoA synthetase
MLGGGGVSPMVVRCRLLGGGRRQHHSNFLTNVTDPKRKDSIAVIDSAGSVTYGELDMLSNDLVSAINSRGLLASSGNNTTIAGFNPSNRHYVVSLLAAWKCGKAFLPLCPIHPEHELRYFLEDSKAGLVLSSSHPVPVADITGLSVPALAVDSVSGTENSSQPHQPQPEHSTGGENALILYTSGTTGKPKGVMHTHAGVNAMISDLTSAWEYSSSDKILHFLPLHHLHGVLNKLLCTLHVGATVEFMPSAQAKVLWNRLATESSNLPDPVTIFMAVPTVYAKLLEYHREVMTKGSDNDKSALQRAVRAMHDMRLMVSGSAALPDNVLHAWKDLSGHTLLERYGMTEIGMGLTNPYRGPRKPGYVGKPFASVKCRIMDDHEKVISSPETPGELRIKGPTVFTEYLNRPKDTAEAFDSDGWFRTGDVAVVNEEGEYRLLGRMSADIIKVSNYSIAP